MNRRAFLSTSLIVAGGLALPKITRAADATPEAGGSPAFPLLEIALTDNAFAFPQPLNAGRYQVKVSNDGTSSDSHFALGKIPDSVTDDQYQAWIDARGEDTDALTFEAIDFVGVPDWPRPGGSVSGIVDIAPGRYFLFDPFDARGFLKVQVDGTFEAAEEPASDLTVTLQEMEIVLPDSAFTTDAVRWRIENKGAMSHEVAVIPVDPEFTEEDLKVIFSLPDEATPPPSTSPFVYKPSNAIGILAKQHTSWLDVQLKPGHYLAACMLPFGTGYPHAIDGMYRFFEVK